MIINELSDLGSSPRVWGQVSILSGSRLMKRIIPTRMGTSNRAFSAISYSEDHPHAYGDTKDIFKHRACRQGSSPRVWGQGRSKFYYALYSRIIPTRMGTRRSDIFLPRLYQDHPHAYGDKSPTVCNCPSDTGSSPRVWGQVS